MPAAIQKLGGEHGFNKVKKWNVSQLLKDLGILVARYKDGWAITDHGKDKLAELGLLDESPTKSPQIALRAILPQISDDQSRIFVEEAVQALEYKLLRSAVVLSWVGAVAVLHKKVFDNHLHDFYNELKKSFPKAKPIKKLADLGDMKESNFLTVACSAGIFDKNIKGELEGCLKYRNGCGHPNALKIAPHRVASHIETLILHVYEPFT